MKIEIPEIKELQKDIKEFKELINDKSRFDQEWYSLESACKIKGINHNSLQGPNRRYQPKFGVPDSNMLGRRWRRETVIPWVKMSHEEIDERYKVRN